MHKRRIGRTKRREIYNSKKLRDNSKEKNKKDKREER